MRSPFPQSVVVILVLTAALLACKSGPKEVKASCDMRGATASESSSICIDFYSEPNDKVRQICSSANGYVLAPKPCDHSSALGGCKKGNLTNWYYSSSRHSTAADVQKECASDFIAASP